MNARSRVEKPYNLIYEAEWNDIPCADYPLTPEKWASESIRPLVGTQVDALFYNLCSSDGFCCELENGDILMDNFEQIDEAWVWRYRENTKGLIKADANPPKLAVEYCRRLGMKAIPVVRMNDFHDQINKQEVTRFKQDHPELLIGYGSYIDWEKLEAGHPDQMSWDCRTWGMFDFAHEEVRERKFRIVEEFITRWDNDGVCLDFERHPRFFKELGSAANADTMTELVRRVRATLDDLSQKRGKPLYLHARVLPDIAAAYDRGLDVRRWIEESLVDGVSLGGGYVTLSLDLKPWLEMVRNRDCWVYPCVNGWRTPEQTRAWAKLMYQQGSHGLHLFNWGHMLYGFDKNTQPTSQTLGTVWYDELHPCYYESLSEIGEPKAIAQKDTVYKMESWPRGMRNGGFAAPDIQRFFWAADAMELSIELSVGAHTMNLPFAEDVEAARDRAFLPAITLRLKLENYTVPDKFDVSINGTVLDASTRKERAVHIMDNDTWIEYPVDPVMLNRGSNELKFTVHSLNPQMSVTPVLQNLELVVKYVGA